MSAYGPADGYADALGMLRELHLSDEEAAAVLVHAVAHGILAAEGDTLCPGPALGHRPR
jgi:hypothetical protein